MNKESIPWVEKYRPDIFEDIILDNNFNYPTLSVSSLSYLQDTDGDNQFNPGDTTKVKVVVSNDWGVIQTQTIIKNTAEPSLFMDMLLPTALLPVVYLIFSKMYKWKRISQLFKKGQLTDFGDASESNNHPTTFKEI